MMMLLCCCDSVSQNMKTLRESINIILVMLVFFLSGCGSTGSKKDKSYSLINFHLEAVQDGSGRSGYIPIYRASPVQINVSNQPFLDVGYITQAAVIENVGGFGIRIQFDETGTKRLQHMSTSNRGKRIAIYSNFDDSRWLAAPMIHQTINDGVFIFTPDATREESERIVEGINNVAEELKKPYVF